MKSKKVQVSARKRRLILTSLIALSFISCGVTKATIARPAEGTHTTITITTNNPINTDVSPDLNVNPIK